MKFGCSNIFFLNTINLICRSTDISKCFRGSLRFRDNESRLYLFHFIYFSVDYETHDDEEYSRSVKVVSTHDGVQKEVHYETLDSKDKKEVLTDLLVKSAVHYAMKKQQVKKTS